MAVLEASEVKASATVASDLLNLAELSVGIQLVEVTGESGAASADAIDTIVPPMGAVPGHIITFKSAGAGDLTFDETGASAGRLELTSTTSVLAVEDDSLSLQLRDDATDGYIWVEFTFSDNA